MQGMLTRSSNSERGVTGFLFFWIQYWSDCLKSEVMWKIEKHDDDDEEEADKCESE